MSVSIRRLAFVLLGALGCAHAAVEEATAPSSVATPAVTMPTDEERYQQHLAFLQSLSHAQENAVALEIPGAAGRTATAFVIDGTHLLAPQFLVRGHEAEVFARGSGGAKIPARVLASDDATGLVLLSAIVYSAVRPLGFDGAPGPRGRLTLVGADADGRVGFAAARPMELLPANANGSSGVPLIGELRPGTCGAAALNADGSLAGLVTGGSPCTEGNLPMTLLPASAVAAAVLRMKSAIGE